MTFFHIRKKKSCLVSLRRYAAKILHGCYSSTKDRYGDQGIKCHTGRRAVNLLSDQIHAQRKELLSNFQNRGADRVPTPLLAKRLLVHVYLF